jgi:ABC-type multidrug transport system ATPase subunit
MIIINKGSKVVEGDVQELLDAAILDLKIDVSEPEKAFGVLKNTFSRTEIRLETEGSLIMKVNKSDIPQINKTLVDNGFMVYSINPVNSLEQYFLEKT